MSLRILGCLLLVIAVVALRAPLAPAASQATQAAAEPVWEYHVVNLDSRACISEEAMTATLNANGRQGWELVGYQAGPVQMPGTVDGSIVMRPAATGAGKDVSPQLADSFQGTISLKMSQAPQVGACRLVFKREAVATGHQ
jgi:Domain of unknown function (DUF4177)